eukprot:9235693-Pyramimonas_sp.AAC.1
MQNLFNSAEWPAIRESISEYFQEADATVNWGQQQVGTSVLPDDADSSSTLTEARSRVSPSGPSRPRSRLATRGAAQTW